MIKVTQRDDNSFDIEWDENDPVESQLNHWEEKDFIQVITDACKENSDVQ